MIGYPWKTLDYDKRNLFETLDSAILAGHRLAEDLLHTVASLPRVDRDGGSPCPYAEDLYAAKEAKEDVLRCHLPCAVRT
jgi:hypothetical protein